MFLEVLTTVLVDLDVEKVVVLEVLKVVVVLLVVLVVLVVLVDLEVLVDLVVLLAVPVPQKSILFHNQFMLQFYGAGYDSKFPT